MIRTRSLCGAGGARALTQCSRSRAEVRPEHRRLLRLRDAHIYAVRVLPAARGCLAASSSRRSFYLLFSFSSNVASFILMASCGPARRLKNSYGPRPAPRPGPSKRDV